MWIETLFFIVVKNTLTKVKVNIVCACVCERKREVVLYTVVMDLFLFFFGFCGMFFFISKKFIFKKFDKWYIKSGEGDGNPTTSLKKIQKHSNTIEIQQQ